MAPTAIREATLAVIEPVRRSRLYQDIVSQIQTLFDKGELRPGDQLPTVRQMAVDLQVNANTVARVYAELERSGVIETKRGVGSFITASPAQAHPPREHERRVRTFITRVLADADAHGLTVDDVIAGLRAHRKGGT